MATDTNTDALVDLAGAGKIEILACKDLQVDPYYQRDLSRDLVETIKNNWDVAGAGFITVSRRDSGAIFVVNGQHRVAARMELAREQGDESGGEMIAQVFEGLNQQQEAQLRLIGNTKRTDSSQERFRAQLAAGNAESVAIQAILKEFGTRINPSPDTKHGINAVSSVEEIYRIDNGRLLTRVLEVIKDSFDEVGGITASVAMLKGVAFFLSRHRTDVDRTRFVERLGAEGPDAIERRGRSQKLAMGGPLWLNFYRAFIESYNHRLTERARLEPRPGGWSVSRMRSWERA